MNIFGRRYPTCVLLSLNFRSHTQDRPDLLVRILSTTGVAFFKVTALAGQDVPLE